MTTMPLTFWLFAALPLIPALILLLYPLWRKKALVVAAERTDAKSRLKAELQRDNERGLVSGNYDDLVNELDDSESGRPEQAPAPESAPKRRLAAACVLIVLLGGTAAYYPHAFNYEAMALLEERMRQNAATYDERVGEIRAALQSDPEDADHWLALAETHAQFGNYRLAISAYEEAESRQALAPAVRAAYAEAIILDHGQGGGEPDDDARGAKAEELINSVLAEDPKHMVALWLSGVLLNQRGDYAAAAQQWKMLLPLLPEEADTIRGELITHIKAADERANGPASEVNERAGRDATQGAAVNAVLRVDDKVMERVRPNDTVLVYAKAVRGPPMPLAVERVPFSSLPTTVRLNKRSAMMEGLTMDAFDKIVITARVSRDGQAKPRSGEPFGVSPVFDARIQEHVEIVIDQLIP